ncbi:MAG: cupin domain-containing protein [Ignavibacteria bacterium]|nr:cupin domain-containing protein [Ignavibacteria bacterium]
MKERDSDYWKAKLSLTPHREGGYFKEIYRSEGSSNLIREGDERQVERNHGTAIYFLLQSGEMNTLHRIKSDEVWHFYDGSRLAVHEIDSAGNLITHLLGLDIESGESPVIVIKAGNWFCAEVADADTYTLAGCTVSPGFDFDDFELADKKSLLEVYPNHKEFIEKFTI